MDTTEILKSWFIVGNPNPMYAITIRIIIITILIAREWSKRDHRAVQIQSRSGNVHLSASQYAASCSSSCIISTHTTRNVVRSAISAGSIATTNDASDTRWALCMSMTPPLAPIKPPPFCIWCFFNLQNLCSPIPAPKPHHFSYWAPGDWVGYNVTDSAFKIELQFLHNDWTQCLILGFKQGTKKSGNWHFYRTWVWSLRGLVSD